MRKAKVFYTIGNVITKAAFLGFVVKVETDMCTHKGCGALGVHAICEKCGSATTKTRRDSYWFKRGTCSEYGCDGKLGPTQKSKKAQCHMSRYRTLTDSEVCSPTQEIKLALLEVELAGRTGISAFIVDLNKKVFLSTEMRVDWNEKTQRYAIRETDKRTWSQMNINNIKNKEDIISKIWDTFKND